MSNSVNTNYGALVALQSLNRTNADLASVQKRVTTGYRVNDAIDDGAAFAVAQGIRSNIGSLNAVNQQLNIARGTNGVALEAATSISNTLIKMREVTTKLADANLSSDQRRQYNADLSRLVGEVGNFIVNATFNGSNLLQSAAAPIQVIANVAGTQFTLTSQDLSANLLGGGTNLLTVAFANAVAAGAALSANGSQASAESIVSTFLNNHGGDSRRLVNQVNFNAALLKASEEALGFIVDADLAKESSRLQSLQIRQQLGTQTLGIANQSPQTLLGLFR
ncbi:MAG: flagellin [Rhodospirillales bacterium]